VATTRVAITRGISPAVADCELTHLARAPIDLDAARRQHAAYEATLASLGCRIERLAADPAAPDCVFVEDIALVFDELAVITRPGAVSRRRETPPVADALGRYRRLAFIEANGTLDGGDVLIAGRRVFVGLTKRTDGAGAASLARVLEPVGYTVQTLAVDGVLHLKSAASVVAPGLVLVDPECVDAAAFADFDIVTVAAGEGPAANALRLVGTVLLPAGFPATRRKLEDRGLTVRSVENGELAKAEGGLTCCSLIFDVRETAE
jgi:dimethylargininase